MLSDESNGVLRGIFGEIVGRRRAVDEDASLRRRVPVREEFDVVDERGFPRAGGSDDADDVAHFQGKYVEEFFVPVPAYSTVNGDFLDFHILILPL